MHSNTAFVPNGGFMSYSPDRVAQFRRAATYFDKILKGAKPLDLPIEPPMSFELAVNMTMANALGLTMPPEIMVRATGVIE